MTYYLNLQHYCIRQVVEWNQTYTEPKLSPSPHKTAAIDK